MQEPHAAALQDKCLSMEVTTLCNSACSHCFVRARGARGESIPPELAQQLLQEGYDLGYRDLHITGGEPLLWKGLFELLDYASDLGYQKVFLNTNGRLLSGDLCRRLASHKGLAVSISVQGPKRLHDSVRGNGSYDGALHGAKTALSAGLAVHVFTVVGRRLLPDLHLFGNELFDALPDIRRLTFIQIIRVPSDVFDLSTELLSPEDFITFVRKVSLLSLYGMKVDVLNNPLATITARVLKMPWLPFSQPLYRSGSVMVTADLRVTLAHSSTHSFGRYEPGALREIVHSAEYCSAVSGDKATCLDCLHTELCRNGGMTNPSEWYRDMSPQLPYCVRVLSKALAHG